MQVLPSHKPRYAITLWFIDGQERDRRAELDSLELEQELQKRHLPQDIKDNMSNSLVDSMVSGPSGMLPETESTSDDRDVDRQPPSGEVERTTIPAGLCVDREPSIGQDGDIYTISFPGAVVDERFVSGVHIDANSSCVVLSFTNDLYPQTRIDPSRADAILCVSKTRAKFSKKRGTLTLVICYE